MLQNIIVKVVSQFLYQVLMTLVGKILNSLPPKDRVVIVLFVIICSTAVLVHMM